MVKTYRMHEVNKPHIPHVYWWTLW